VGCDLQARHPARQILEAPTEANGAAEHKVPRPQAHLHNPSPDEGAHPKIVSEMLGHSSVSITLDVYSHVIPGLGEAAASAMEDALGD
jgi:integrase